MSGLESAALRVGGILVRLAATTWLARVRAEKRRGGDLTELIAMSFDGLRERDKRALARKFDETGELVGERLERLCGREFGGLAENERVAALDAVVDALADADLSDTVLLGTDLDPTSLAKEVRRQVPALPRRAGLNDAGRVLFDRALDHCCVHLVLLVRELPEYGARLAEETLRRSTAVLAGIEDVLDRLPVTSLDAPSGTTSDDQFGRRYRDLVAAFHDDLELVGVSVRNFRPRTKLSSAYLGLTVNWQDGPVRDGPHESWFGEHRSVAGSVRVEDALSKSLQSLVRGEAGSGKSTLLRWLAVQAARGSFGPELDDWNDRVPILIKLRSYAGRALPKPEQFLDSSGLMLGPIPEAWVHRQLRDGRVLLLVDGVDELTKGERPKVQRWLDAVLTSYSGTHVVLTSRPAAAGTKWLEAEGFITVDLEHMRPPDIQDFVGRWHRALLDAATTALPFDRAEVEHRQRDLLSKLDARAHLRNLARSPLMCAMLCALNLDRGGDLPRDRKGLYEAALEMVLDRRETERGIPASAALTLGYREKLVLLQDLAWWLNLNGRAEIDRAMAMDRIGRKLSTMPDRAGTDAEQCLNHLLERSGVIREPVGGRVDFVHRTFQEFLAAREAAEDGHVGLLVEKATSDQWRETVIMAAGLLNRPGRVELLKGILDRAGRADKRSARKLRLLAATCRESLHELPADTLSRVEACVDTLVPPRTTAESRSLSTVGESILAKLPTDLSGLSDAQAAACAYTAALVNGPESMRLLATYARDARTAVQDELIDAWHLYEPEEYARTVLADAPLHDGQIVVRHAHVIPHLAKLNHLRWTHVDVEDEGIGDLSFLAQVDSLRSLRVLSRDSLSATGLRDHPDLWSVTLVSVRDLSELSVLRELPALTNLFVNAGRPLRDLRFLAGMQRLKFLRITVDARADLDVLSRLENLDDLLLEAEEPELVLDRLPRPEKLRRLGVFTDLSERPISLEFVVSRFPRLEWVHLQRVAAFGTAALDRHVHLRQLAIWNVPPDTNFACFESLTGLRSLELDGAGEVDLSTLRNPDVKVEVGDRLVVRNAGTTRITPRRGPKSTKERQRTGHRYRYEER